MNEVAQKYIEEWTRTQLDIWREKIERLKIVRSGALHQSFTDYIRQTAEGSTIIMKFLSYGIYMENGTGYGYRRDNGGDLPFLGQDYRKEHGLDRRRKVGPAWGGYKTSGKARKPREWYSKKLYMSTMSMVEDMARILADEAAHVVCDQLLDANDALK